MPRAQKASGGGSAKKRKDRRQAKFNPGVGPHSVKPVGGGDALAPPRLEPKRKPPGKLGKKRKAELGGGGGGSRDLDDAADAAARATKKPKRPPGASDRGGGSQKKKPPPTRKEQKEWSNEQKALQKPNFQLVQTIVGLWERLRVKKIAKSDRRALVDAIFDAAKGKVPEIANNHKGSRVIQALLKYGTPEERESVYAVRSQIAPLAKSLYGHPRPETRGRHLQGETPRAPGSRQGQRPLPGQAPRRVAGAREPVLPRPAQGEARHARRIYGSESALFGAGDKEPSPPSATPCSANPSPSARACSAR